MPLHRVSKLMIALVIISLIGIISIFLSRYKLLQGCRYADERICRFIQTFNRNPGTFASGSYVQTSKFGKYSGTWKIDQNIEQFTLYKGDSEVMNFIIDDSYMYLKDYKDGKWWQQKIEDSKLFETQIPFDPKVFFSTIKTDLSSEQTEFMFIQSLSCGIKQCHRFQMKNPKISGQKFLYITADSQELNRAVVASDQIAQEIVVTSYEKQAIKLPEEVKEATVKQNLFLEWISEQKEEDKNYDYLKEFQEQRQNYESQGSSSAAISPSP